MVVRATEGFMVWEGGGGNITGKTLSRCKFLEEREMRREGRATIWGQSLS